MIWRLIAIAFAVACLLLIWARVEAGLLHKVYSHVTARKERGADSRITHQTLGHDRPLSAARPPLRIALISDFHGRLLKVSLPKLASAIRAAKVDLVLFAGDLISRKENDTHGLARLAELSDLLKPEEIEIYAVRGNHDAGVPPERYHATGLRLLENETIVISDRNGLHWCVVGLPDPQSAAPQFDRALQSPAPFSPIRGLRPESVPPHRRIVLTHDPDQIHQLNRRQCSTLLAGHFHGGQIRLPFRLECRLLRRKDRLCQQGVYRWHFERNEIRGYITKGVGCVLVPLRFLCPPELSILDFDTDES